MPVIDPKTSASTRRRAPAEADCVRGLAAAWLLLCLGPPIEEGEAALPAPGPTEVAAPRREASQDGKAAKKKEKEEDEDPIRFKAVLGYDASGLRAWERRWNVLHLEIENAGKHPFEGRIVVRKERSDENLPGTTYTGRAAAAPGTRKRLSMLVFIEPNDKRLEVRLEAGRYGARLAFIQIIPYRPEEECVIVCADDAAGTARLLALEESEADELGNRPQRYCYVVPAGLLPDDRAGYGGAAAVVFETGDLGDLTDTRAAALREYVHAGGTLVVSAGRHAAAIARSLLADLLPVEILGSETVDRLDLRLTFGASPSRAPLQKTFPGRFTVAALKPRDGAAMSAGAAAARRGLGWVVFLPFSLSELSRAVKPGENRTLIDSIMLKSEFAREGSLAQFISGKVKIHDLESHARNGIDASLRNSLVVRFPPVDRIAALLALYVASLVPLNWLLWRRRHRKEYAWGVAAALSIGFGYAYYAWGTAGAGTVLTGQSDIAIRCESGSTAAPYRAFYCLYAPGHTRGDLRLKSAPGFACQSPLLSRLRVSHAERGVRALDYAVRWEDPACVFDAFEIYPAAARTFEAEGTCSLGGGLLVEPRKDDKGEVVGAWVTNRTPWTLADVCILGLPGKGHDAEFPIRLSPGQSGWAPRASTILVAGPEERVVRDGSLTDVPVNLMTESLPDGQRQYLLDVIGPRVSGPYVTAAIDAAELLRPVYAGYTVSQKQRVILEAPVPVR